MDYKTEHRKHILNTYLTIKGKDIMEQDKNYIVVKDIIYNIPKTKYKIIDRSRGYIHKNLVYYGKNIETPLLQIIIENEDITICNTLYDRILNVSSLDKFKTEQLIVAIIDRYFDIKIRYFGTYNLNKLIPAYSFEEL